MDQSHGVGPIVDGGVEKLEPKPFMKNLLLNAQAMDEATVENTTKAILSNRRSVRKLANQMMADGFIRTEAEREYFVMKATAFGRDDKAALRTRWFYGFSVPASRRIWEVYQDLHERFGGDSSCTVEIRGRTGTGKSGVALILAQALGTTPGQMEDTVHYHPRPFLTAVDEAVERRMAGKPYVPVVIMDESPLDVGEGAQTNDKVLRNKDGRLREGGISKIFIRPNVDDELTRDITFEMIGVSEKLKQYLAIAYFRDEVAGFVQLKWPEPELWQSYHVVKKRSLTGIVDPESENTRREVMEALANEELMQRILDAGSDDDVVEFWVHRNQRGVTSVTQLRRIVRLVKKGAALYDSPKDFRKFTLQFWADGLPYGLSLDSARTLLTWRKEAA